MLLSGARTQYNHQMEDGVLTVDSLGDGTLQSVAFASSLVSVRDLRCAAACRHDVSTSQFGHDDAL